MTIFLAIIASILLMGMIGDKEPDNRRNYSQCFMVTVAAIVVLTILAKGGLL